MSETYTFSYSMLIFYISTIFMIAFIVGFFMANLVGSKGKLRNELKRAKKDVEEYQKDINDHLEASAKLMQDIGVSYKNLYTHFTSQATKFSKDSSAQNIFPDNLLSYEANKNGISSMQDTQSIQNDIERSE